MDSIFMQRCVQLAYNGKSTCSPNPMVGAVVVHEGRIVGEGWHHKAGEPHAEPNAIFAVSNPEWLKTSTLYVSLEPCSHYGKTPPCVDLIIEKQISRVVIGCLDPFPLVSGRGVKKLRAAGIEVILGIEEEACIHLNQSFFHFQKFKRPYVILKWAQTADGYLDILRKPGDQKDSLKISSPFTRMLTHKNRSECDAILVGTNTAILDNPSLNVRYWDGKNPVRAVIDCNLVLPMDSILLNNQTPTLIFNNKISMVQGNISWIQIDFNKNVVSQILQELYSRKLQTLLVEGGTILHQSFLKEGLWNEIQVETSPQKIEMGVSAPDLSGLNSSSKELLQYEEGAQLRKMTIYRSANSL